MGRDDGLPEIAGQTCGKRIAALRPARVHANLGETEDAVEQTYIPVRGSPRADMAEYPARSLCQMSGTDRGDRTGAHVGQPSGIDHRDRRSGPRIEEAQQAHLGRQRAPVIIDVIADDLDAGKTQRRHIAAKHVEVPAERRVRGEMHARLDHRLAAALRQESPLDRGENLVIGERQRGDVRTVQIIEVELGCGGHRERRQR